MIKHKFPAFLPNIRKWIPLLLLLVVLVVKSALAAAPKGYKITVKLQSSKDTCLLLAHYYGNKQYLDDTAYRSKQGTFEFHGDAKLPEGMYIIAGQNKSRYFDFFLTGNQRIEFNCNPAEVTKTMEVKGSDENKLFYDYIRFIGIKQAEIEPFVKWKQSAKTNPDSASIVKTKVDEIDKQVKAYIRNFYTSYPDLLAAHFVKANNEPDLLPFLTDAGGKVDSSRLYPVYKQHYFDNIELSDGRLVYTPVFSNKVDFYLDKLSVPVLDSLEKEIDRLFSLCSANPETLKYAAWYLAVKFESSQVMGHDALFVYIVQKYLEPGKIDWLYPSVKENVLKRVKTLDPLLLGKVAPELILLDSLNAIHSLSAVKARYTLLFFWESTCGHCQKEMPNVVKFYQEFHDKYNLEIFGVSGDTSLVKWKEFVRKNKLPWVNVNGYLSLSGNYHDIYDIHSTPVMYLLDDNKKILTKFLLTDQISDLILKREEALEKQKKKTEK